MEISQQDLRPLLRLIDTSGGEIPWGDYQDDYERRLTELVEAKVAAAQNPRVGKANGRHRGASGRSSGHADAPAADAAPAHRRKAA